jgi:tryptophan synthase beta chain
MTDTVKYVLDERDIPRFWYNIVADLPSPPPPVLHPGTHQPVGPDDLAPIFPMAVIEQEVSTEREIEIPEPVRDIYRQWRPSPLYRARRLEKMLDTPARIYYKYEGVSPAGSHKPNTAIAQAFYNKQEGIKRITTETGAGQWGSALSIAGAFFGLEIEVFMVKVSFQQKPYRRSFMETFGAKCIASPSELTASGRAVLAEHPDSTGSLGIAISEAVERAVERDDTKYALGSVLNHVMLHQTVIGQEAIKQFDLANDYPDVVIAPTGGGSNFAGITFPFLGEQLRGGKSIELIAVEPSACPSLTRGQYAYDFGDTAHLTPLVKMHTLGSTYVPPRLPRRRPALSRHGAAGFAGHGTGPGEAARLSAGAVLRGGAAVCEGRGHHPGARGQPRCACRDRRGAALQGRRREPCDPVQSLRPRQLRHAGVPRFSRRQADGPRVRRRRDRDGARRTAVGGLSLSRSRTFLGRAPSRCIPFSCTRTPTRTLPAPAHANPGRKPTRIRVGTIPA